MSHNILIIAAHSDDEVLGCGGTIAKLTSLGHNVATLFMTDGVSSRGPQNQKNSILKRKLNSEAAASLLGENPRSINNLSTEFARAVDNSQFEGNLIVLIGLLSV